MTTPRRLDDCGDVLSRADLCGLLQISTRQYSRLLRHGQLPPALRLDSRHQYYKEAVRRWLDSRGSQSSFSAARRMRIS